MRTFTMLRGRYKETVNAGRWLASISYYADSYKRYAKLTHDSLHAAAFIQIPSPASRDPYTTIHVLFDELVLFSESTLLLLGKSAL